MFNLRNVHQSGGTRVCVDGQHVLTGGVDGVVALLPLKKWPATPAVWARKCHDSAVTCLVLDDTLQIAISAGRDGKVFLHENIHATENGSTSRLLCRLTGEVRCVIFDPKQKRIFVGGDSFRCLNMHGNQFDISPCPMPETFATPVLTASLSSCGNLLALGNATGQVAVIPAAPNNKALDFDVSSSTQSGNPRPSASTDGDAEKENKELSNASILLEKTFSELARKEDNVRFQMSFIKTSFGLLLFVPTSKNVQIFKIAKDAINNRYKAQEMASLQTDFINGVSSCYAVAAHCVSLRRISCVVASSKRIFSAKIDSKKFDISIEKEQTYESETSDLSVCPKTGDVSAGFLSGQIAHLSKFALKAAHGDPNSDEVKMKKKSVKEKSEKISEEISNEEADTSSEEEENDNQDGEKNEGESECTHEKRSRRRRASSSSSSSSDSADYDSDNIKVINEDLGHVVDELKKNNAHFMETDSKRPSLWRKKDKSKAEIEAYKHMSYVEDEAMDATSSENESEAEEGFYDDDKMDNELRARGKVNERTHTRENDDDLNGDDDDYHDNDGDDELDDTESTHKRNAMIPSNLAAPSITADYFFQVGATPVGEEGSCYLAYNSVGFVHSSRDSTMIHFHDISHPAIPITRKGVLMASLSPVGAGFVLAPPDMDDPMMMDANGGDGIPRLSIYYRTFNAFGSSSEWQVQLQPEEMVRCMTAGIKFLAVATSNYLRIFSLSGLELAVLSKFQHIVSMVGTSSEKLMRSFRADFDPLAVCFLEGGEHKIEVLDVGSRTAVIPTRSMPLTDAPDGTSHQLQWLGWSEDGPLHTVDTAGVVRMFTQGWGGSWVPVYDPRTSLDQSYNLWVWGVSDEVLLAYRSSRGESPYPAAVAGGLPSERTRLYLPLLRTSNEREMVTWDHLLRREIRTDEIKRQSVAYTEAIAKHDALHDKKILELFNAALREQNTTKALDLATMLELRDNVEVCTKAAHAGGFDKLVQKLLALYEMRMKTKSKRKCALPVEGTVMGEKERDMLLRKLLKNQSSGSVSDESKETKVQTSNTLASSNQTTSVQGGQEKDRNVSANGSAEKERRHITFNEPEKPAPAVTSANGNDATRMLSTTKSPQKTLQTSSTMNPSTNAGSNLLRANSSATNQTSSVASHGAVNQVKPTPSMKKQSNPFGKKEVAVGAATNTSATTIIGETQPSANMEDAHAINSPARNSSSEASRGQIDSPSPSARPSAAHNNILAVEKRNGATFVPKVLPTTFTPAAPSTAAPRTVSADPFLEADADAETATTVTTVSDIKGLLDVGHEEEGFMPRTKSFGEALRKRYREDEEDDLPVPMLPRIE